MCKCATTIIAYNICAVVFSYLMTTELKFSDQAMEFSKKILIVGTQYWEVTLQKWQFAVR